MKVPLPKPEEVSEHDAQAEGYQLLMLSIVLVNPRDMDPK